jgi:very-short-patch-repair endonuclease
LIEVSVPMAVVRRRPGILVHRRSRLSSDDIAEHEGIPVTSLLLTFVDIAARLERGSIEAAINEADKRELIDPEELRSRIDQMPPRPGIRKLRETLDRRTFTLTESQLERRFLPVVRGVGLRNPQTGAYVNGYKVDFYWPDLGLVVETDGLRYHRTPAQQARDRLRDQAHTAAGLTVLRFTHAQVTFEPQYVHTTLMAVATRLNAVRSGAR